MDISLYTDKSCAVAIPYGIGGCEHADWNTHKPWYSANRSKNIVAFAARQVQIHQN